MIWQASVYFSFNDTERDCEVEFTPVKATRDTWGYAGGEPGEPAHVEDIHVLVSGKDVTNLLTQPELNALEDRCINYAEGYGEPDPDVEG
jgi:hypothetical protein